MIVVIGGANVDVKARSAASVVAGTSNPGTVVRSAGGVGRNVAENLARLGAEVALVSAVGADADGDWLLATTAAAGVDVCRGACAPSTPRAPTRRCSTPTASWWWRSSAMAAVDALAVRTADALVAGAALVVLDGNLPPAAVDAVLDLAVGHGVRVVLEPVSVPKAARLAPLLDRRVFAVTPNRDRARGARLGRGPARARGRGGVGA